ncbi:MAG: lytic transglycosylase domain-containing protein [Lentisphaerae bacterium]|nr:lytic transglycosylase domain-containing protein [Lentisphaerota bacterium]
MNYGIYQSRRERSRKSYFLLLFLVTVFAAGIAYTLWRAGGAVYDYFMRSSRYDAIIRNAGLRNHIDPALIKAVVWRESRFDRRALGLKGEIGLMQIMPGSGYAAADWARAHRCRVPSKGALYDPELNIDIGSWYLGRAFYRYRKYKDAMALALCEYNAGPGRAAEWKPAATDQPVIDRITIPSTKQYVKEILKRYDYYKKEESRSAGKGVR